MFKAYSSTRPVQLRSTANILGALSRPVPVSSGVSYSVLAASSRCSSAGAQEGTRPHLSDYKSSSTSRHLPGTTANLLPRQFLKDQRGIRTYSTTRNQSSKNTTVNHPQPNMSLTIRPVTEADKPTWLNLWAGYNTFYKRTIPEEVTETTFSRFLDSSVRMHCAVAEDPDTRQLIGFIHWYPHISTSSIKEIVYIHDLFVDPTVRNRGTGRKLIEHVYEEARKLPASQVYWMTQYYNHVGQILYTKIADRTDFVKYLKQL